MNFWFVFGIVGLLAYSIQLVLGFFQIRHFNHVYRNLRFKGKVAIGKRPGKIKHGTIIMFAIDDNGRIIEAAKMQGISVLAKFKSVEKFNGIDLVALTPYHPLVSKELKITRETIEDARMLYLKVQAGDYKEEVNPSLFQNMKFQATLVKLSIMNKLKRSV